MSSPIATATTGSSFKDFTMIPIQPVFLDPQCRFRRELTVKLSFSYTDHDKKNEKRSWFSIFKKPQSVDYKFITGTDENLPMKISQVKKKFREENFYNLVEFQEIVQESLLPSPKISQDYTRKAQEFLQQNGIGHLSDETITTLLTAVEQVKERTSSAKKMIWKVSSKSPALKKINDAIARKNSHPFYVMKKCKLAKASIRVFPNKVATITIPGEKILSGAFKEVKRELVIKRDQSFSLVRRYKVKKLERTSRFYERFVRCISLQASVKGRIITPQVAIFSPKHKVQYFAQDCHLDLFSFMALIIDRPQTSSSTHDGAYVMNYFYEKNLEEQSLMLMEIMIFLFTTLFQFHKQGFIHNDIKPDNILLRYNGNSFIPYLCDLDSITRIEDFQKLDGKMITPFYRSSYTIRNPTHNDLYALAQTFAIEDPTQAHHPCFTKVFEALQQEAKKLRDTTLEQQLENLVITIKKLSFNLKELPKRFGPTDPLYHPVGIYTLCTLRNSLAKTEPRSKVLSALIDLDERGSKKNKKAEENCLYRKRGSQSMTALLF